ncbi:hypothetical protein GFU83_10055 [Salmonella enterica]|nr:type III secretion system effector PipB2 [Salmonella enterica]EDK0181122.1 hypothetical protein [Salmonella enterica]ELG3353178.1 type III secretion system effector PipB2 [Salmonella enterica]
MERSLDSLAGMAKSAFGAGTSAAMRQATSPKTILEYIINFFTCGGIRRRNETQYQELIETMAETLKSTMPDRGAPLPENIILDDMDGCRVEFNLPGENNEAGQVIVRVSKGDHSETREIPLASFEKICRALLFRCEFSLPQDSVILTAQGGMNLKGAILTRANLQKASFISTNLGEADLSEANLKNTSFKDCTLTDLRTEDATMSTSTQTLFNVFYSENI